jgi:tRNA(Ile)-lysidine synthase
MALLALAVAAGCHVHVVHVDHQLRDGSHREADVVRSAANTLGATFSSETVNVADGSNLEARARAARYSVLPADSLTGHTADDQAETVLINLLRGAGTSGVAGMRHDGRRPLLLLRRAETEALCELLALDVVRDPSNDDPRYLRNRVRHELLPAMGDLAQRDVVPILARQAALARDESDLLDHLATALDPTDATSLAAAPVVLARRAVRRWLTGEHPPDAATVERVLDVARGRSTATDVGGGRRIERHRQRLDLVDLRDSPASE